MPEDDLFARLATILPGRPDLPEPWLLGSSPQSGIWAAQLGLPYAFADFINPMGAEIAARYREEFMASERQREPRTIVAVWAICAETNAEAERLAASSQMAFTLLQRGQLIAVPPVETALEFLDQDRTRADTLRDVLLPSRRKIVGSPAVVRDGIEAVAREYGAEEVMIVTITYEHAARRRSYELIAEAFAASA